MDNNGEGQERYYDPPPLRVLTKNSKAMTEIQGIRFYSVKDTAKELNVSIATVRNYLRQGKLQGRRVGRPILITEGNIREFLAVE